MSVWRTMARVLISIGAVAFIWWRVPVESFRVHLTHADVSWLAYAFGVLLCAFFVSSWKWYQIGNGIFGLSHSFARYTQVFFAGFFYQMFLPGGQLIGEGMKIARLRGSKSDIKSVFASQLVDRLTGFVALALLLGVMFFLNSAVSSNIVNAVALGVVIGIGVCSVVLLFVPHLYRLLPERMYVWVDALAPLHGQAGRLCFMTGIAIVAHACSATTLLLTLRSVGIEISFSYAVWTYLMMGVVLFIPVSYAGIGLREGALLYYLGVQGFAYDHIFAASVLFFFIQVSIGLLGGIGEGVFLWKRRSGGTNMQIS